MNEEIIQKAHEQALDDIRRCVHKKDRNERVAICCYWSSDQSFTTYIVSVNDLVEMLYDRPDELNYIISVSYETI